MKTINVRDLQKKVREWISASQKDYVVVTRHGKPVAMVTGVEGYDWEDLYLATNTAFWKMIEERRKEKGIPLDEVCRRLGVRIPRAGNGRRRKPD